MKELSRGVQKFRDTYSIKQNSPIYLKEFGFYGLDNWIKQGYIKDYGELAQICEYDESGVYGVYDLGWCEAPFIPAFEEKVLEDRGDYELVLDYAGRSVLYFKGRRNGFMPEYVDHPVKDMKTWEENCKWRLLSNMDQRLKYAAENAKRAAEDIEVSGRMASQGLIGGYMYLRSLIGPADLLYMFYDNPDVIHDCMKTWFEVSDNVIAEHQKYVTFDEIFMAEDICYNTSCLISPDMMDEFLLPYYQQLITNMKSRQKDNRHLFYQVDTDGFADCVIPMYRKLGMDVMSPFEAASNCDVVRAGREYPDLVISGGIDKRVLAQGKDAIDAMLDYIMPAMYKRGGYIPTCDHGVPEEVSFENYVYFRNRLKEYAK